jgi:hypothetical protein
MVYLSPLEHIFLVLTDPAGGLERLAPQLHELLFGNVFVKVAMGAREGKEVGREFVGEGFVLERYHLSH